MYRIYILNESKFYNEAKQNFFFQGKQGQPSFWRVLKYPQLDISQALTSRSSFQADKATFHWNKRGTNLFAMTQTDVSDNN